MVGDGPAREIRWTWRRALTALATIYGSRSPWRASSWRIAMINLNVAEQQILENPPMRGSSRRSAPVKGKGRRAARGVEA